MIEIAEFVYPLSNTGVAVNSDQLFKQRVRSGKAYPTKNLGVEPIHIGVC